MRSKWLYNMSRVWKSVWLTVNISSCHSSSCSGQILRMSLSSFLTHYTSVLDRLLSIPPLETDPKSGLLSPSPLLLPLSKPQRHSHWPPDSSPASAIPVLPSSRHEFPKGQSEGCFTSAHQILALLCRLRTYITPLISANKTLPALALVHHSHLTSHHFPFLPWLPSA